MSSSLSLSVDKVLQSLIFHLSFLSFFLFKFKIDPSLIQYNPSTVPLSKCLSSLYLSFCFPSISSLENSRPPRENSQTRQNKMPYDEATQ